MKVKFLVVLFLLAAEMFYASMMILETKDPLVVDFFVEMPVVGDWYYEYRISDTREKAEAGDVHEMMALYYESIEMDRLDDKLLATRLLLGSGTATAQLFLFFEEGREIETENSREFMLLMARAMHEDIRPYVPDDSENKAYTQQSRRYAAEFDLLKESARNGDKNARWVLENLGLSTE